MKEKARKAVIITAGVLITAVILTVFLYYYNDKVKRDNAWIYSADDVSSEYSGYVEKSDINKVDFDTLMQVKGIGRKIAHDIINYRDKLGKFTDMSQLKEINSVNNEVYLILCEHFTVKSGSGYYQSNESYGVAKVNLNTASVNKLMSVEGVTQQIAENIILRRKDHGDYTSVRELLDTDGITIVLYNEISDKFTV